MSVAHRKLGVVALLAGLLVIFASVRPGAQAPVVQADLAAPGGISALPSAAPAIPGLVNQGIPAIIRARGPGNKALVTVFCDPLAEAPFLGQQRVLFCPDLDDDGSNLVTFEITRVFPPDTAPLSTFVVTAGDELVCGDGAPCDYNALDGVVVVEVQGGGVNEIIEVTATDEIGESRSVQIVVVDTILAWGPTGVVTTASQRDPAFVSYACDDVGQERVDSADDPATEEGINESPNTPAFDNTLAGFAEAHADDDGVLGLDDLWELLYGGKPAALPPIGGSGLNLGGLDNIQPADIDIPLVWCGGDTESLMDDFVDFQTDKGVVTVDPSGVETSFSQADAALALGLLFPPMLDFDCGEGKNVDVFDIDSLSVWGNVLSLGDFTEGGCDADFARNGVVTAMVLGTGEVGVATISGQQGGGVSPTRTVNLTMIGEASLGLFIEAPEALGVDGGEFNALVVDESGRPVGEETVQCMVTPTGGALVVVPQTGTTGALDSDHPGEVAMTLVPTGASIAAGEEITLTCMLDRDRSVSASAIISLATEPGIELVDLPGGCVPVGSTWEDDTDIKTVAGAVEPADALVSLWAFDPGSRGWQAWSAAAQGASDLRSVDRLEVIFVCTGAEEATVGRPML